MRGPPGGNQQSWDWVVVTDPAIKQQVTGWYRESWSMAYGHRPEQILAAAPPACAGLRRRSFMGAGHLAQHIEQAPVWIFPVLRNRAGASNQRLGASIYGAVQQLILTARAFGAGTSLTLLYAGHQDGPRGLLGLPDDVTLTMELLPLGLPARGRRAQPERRPVEEVVHWNRWGATATPADHPRRPWRRSAWPSRLDSLRSSPRITGKSGR